MEGEGGVWPPAATRFLTPPGSTLRGLNSAAWRVLHLTQTDIRIKKKKTKKKKGGI